MAEKMGPYKVSPESDDIKEQIKSDIESESHEEEFDMHQSIKRYEDEVLEYTKMLDGVSDSMKHSGNFRMCALRGGPDSIERFMLPSDRELPPHVGGSTDQICFAKSNDGRKIITYKYSGKIPYKGSVGSQERFKYNTSKDGNDMTAGTIVRIVHTSGDSEYQYDDGREFVIFGELPQELEEYVAKRKIPIEIYEYKDNIDVKFYSTHDYDSSSSRANFNYDIPELFAEEKDVSAFVHCGIEYA